MFIEIKTKTLSDNGIYTFTHTHYLDEIEIDVKYYTMPIDENLSDSPSYKELLGNQNYLDLFADACNIGQALNCIINADKKFGVKKKHSSQSEFMQMKTNQPKQWIEYLSGEKRFAVVTTDNQETYRNVMMWHSIPNHYLIRCYERLLRLKNNFYIALHLSNKFDKVN